VGTISRPAMTESTIAVSATVRANGPMWSSDQPSGTMPSTGTSPCGPLRPTTPQYAAGRRIEPTVCEPSAVGTMRSATAAAEPDEEPPGVRAGSNGFVVGPGCAPPSSAVTVLPSTTAPAWRSAHTAALSRFGKLPR